MKNLTQIILKNYYGFCDDENGKKSLASHEAFQKELLEEKSVETAANGACNEKDSPDIRRDSEAQIDNTNDNKVTANDYLRKYGALTEDDELIDDPDEEGVDLMIENTRTEVQDDGRVGIPKLGILERPDGTDEMIELGIIDETTPDSASDIGSLSMKKKIRKKSMIGISKRDKSPALSHMPLIPKKNPIYNREFCDLTNSSIIEFPINLLDEIQSIRMLYLENNCLNELPEQLFTSLRFLQWLDVRNNWLRTVPVTMKHHQHLETILLQGNRIEKLPLELCLVPKLKTLQLAGNPLEFPPVDVVSRGFTHTINFLRKEWNKENPNEPAIPAKEIKSASTILCDSVPTINASRSSKLLIQSSALKSIKSLSIREKSRKYKPSNRYGQLPSKEYDLLELNYRTEDLNKKCKTLSLCDDCREIVDDSPMPSPVDEWDCFINYEKLKIKVKGRANDINYDYNSSGSSSLAMSRKDAETIANIDENVDNFDFIKLPKIRERNFIKDVERLEDIKVKERVYNIMTNDRIMTKLRPMRLHDPDWTLGFIENYLGIDNRPIAYFPKFRKIRLFGRFLVLRCSGSPDNSLLDDKLRWISKVREMLVKQAAQLQKIKDREVLKDWRNDRRSYDKSMKKAANRSEEKPPFAVDNGTSLLNINNLRKPMSLLERKNMKTSGDIDKRMFEIIESLGNHRFTNESQNLGTDLQLKLLEYEIKKIERLYEEIQALKRQNDTLYKKYSGPNIHNAYKFNQPSPTIIV